MSTASGEDSVVLRPFDCDADYESCLALQRRTWGDDFRELVPTTILMICQKVGGIAAGAFDESQRMLGFVFGLSGVRAGQLAHWSHMLAVEPFAQGRGLGKRLKLYQRDRLLEIGVEVVYWTFDPLVARNANLNINALGARPVEYACDLYGGDTGSGLHDGLGTDRFIVAWEIGSEAVERKLGRARPTIVPPDIEAGPEIVVNSLFSDGRSRSLPKIQRERDTLWIEVPGCIDQVRRESMTQAQGWRLSTRGALCSCLAEGFRVTGFVSAGVDGVSPNEGRGAARAFYRLTRE